MSNDTILSNPEQFDIEAYTSEVVKSSVYVHPNATEIINNTGRVAMMYTYQNLDAIFSSDNYTEVFSRVSTYHGRSIEDESGIIVSNQPISDENGDVYTSYSIKGAAKDSLYAQLYSIEPSGVRVNGLMDASTFTRVKEVSEVLRREGVLTEWPIYFARPKDFPVTSDKRLNLLGLKRRLYYDLIFENDMNKAIYPESGNIPVGVVGAIGSGLLDMEFGVMYRASLSNARLCDIRALDRNELDDRTKNAIESLQLREPKYLTQWDNIKDLDPSNPDDRQRYLTQILPELIAENVARFHNANAYHKYLHDGNITLAGEIVDLDSVMLPDVFEDDAQNMKPMSKINEAYEVSRTVANAISRYLTEIKHKDSGSDISISSAEMQNYRKNQFADIVIKMKSSYYAERVLSEEISELENILLESIFFDISEIIDDRDLLGAPTIIDLEDPLLEKIIVRDMTRFFEQYSNESEAQEEFSAYFTRNEKTELYVWAKNQIETLLLELNGQVPMSEFIIRQTVNLELIKLLQIIKFETENIH